MNHSNQDLTPDQQSLERPLISTAARLYSLRNNFTAVQLIITQTRVLVARDELIQRDIPLRQIDAITTSTISPEFILHLKEDTDARLGCSQRKREVIEMLVYLLCNSPAGAEAAGKARLYLVEDLSLDLYTTTAEDLEDGHLIRPDPKLLRLVDHGDFVEGQRKADRRRKSAKSLLPVSRPPLGIGDFDLLMTLGRGAHGKVLLCELRARPGELFAVKILKKRHILANQQLEHTVAEMAILSELRHPFLVALRHAFHTDSKVYFVMDFMRGGELFQHMRRVGRFAEEQARFLCACLVLALGHLHSAGYIYRDLKPENVLLDEQGFARLADFGMAKLLASGELARTFCGTPEYLAPEAILRRGCNRAADWWTLGVLAYELLFGAPPFYAGDVQEMYRRTLVEPLRFPARANVSRAAMDFCAGLLVKVWGRRLGAVADALEVMNHSWFADFDWPGLLARKLKPPYRPNAKKWEKNFDPQFICQEARDSKCEDNWQSGQKFEGEFDAFAFGEKNTVELANNSSGISTRGFFLAKAFRQNIKGNLAEAEKIVPEMNDNQHINKNETELSSKNLKSNFQEKDAMTLENCL